MKNKVFSLINVLGLTIGITVCMMIFLFILNEYSVDNFHRQGKNIYRVMRVFDSTKPAVPYLSGPYAPALLNDFSSDIKQAVRVTPSNNLVVVGDKSFNEKKVYNTDSDFFSLFSFPLLRGNTSTALQHPNSVVLTETTAKRYFGSVDNAMGKVIDMDKSLRLKVSAIAKDVPPNSHLDFDLIVPISNYTSSPGFNMWINNSLFVYVLLDEHVNATQLEKKFVPFMHKYMGSDMEKFGMNFSLSLKPLKDIYFENSSSFDNVKHGDKTVVYIFLSVAILILIIACINFMNLSTIRAIERSKEVGLRKVLGALRSNLVWQFIGESVLLTFISCALSFCILQLLLPYYNSLLGYTLTVSWNTWPVYLFLIVSIILVGFLAGSYPAFFLSAFSPVQALKGKLRLGKGGAFFRQILVVIQFSISVFLIVGTIIIMNQMSYVKHKQLGYDQSQTLIIPVDNTDIYNNRVVFKNDLQSNNNIASVTLLSGEPGGFFDMYSFNAEGHNDVQNLRTEYSDLEIVKTLGLKIVAGRDFSSALATDTLNAALINETAANKLGWKSEEAIGKWIKNIGRDSLPRHVVGVVQDFNFLSLKENMDALVITPGNDNRVIAVKMKGGNLQSSLAIVKNAYNKAAPVYPFEYTFLDQKFDQLYKNDLRQQAILSIFSVLAIFIACLGLFGLASFATTKRIKEIGVRKVLGSSVKDIVFLLSKDLLKPVLIATCIAIPVGYYAMHNWLQNFAYRTELSWWIFAFAALITLAVALITICFKAINAALTNPVKSLRTE